MFGFFVSPEGVSQPQLPWGSPGPLPTSPGPWSRWVGKVPTCLVTTVTTVTSVTTDTEGTVTYRGCSLPSYFDHDPQAP